MCYGLRGIRPIRFEYSIRERIGQPIRFEIRFERKKTIRMSLLQSAQTPYPDLRSYFYGERSEGVREAEGKIREGEGSHPSRTPSTFLTD